ncbi:MAG: HigA family addiction module antitoxin [Nitrosopumilus sp.]|nr:HigA family addiction module antitoxin [Nitrosopumilus sp.]
MEHGEMSSLATPGEVLEDYLEFLHMSSKDLAAKAGIEETVINGILEGKVPITQDVAVKLEEIVGRPAHFWANLQTLHGRIKNNE